jgi:hypothetical protein
MRLSFVLACAMLALCQGCASIMCGAEKTVNVSSSPSGASFRVLSPTGAVIAQGITPANVTLKRGRGYFEAGDYRVAFHREGRIDTTTPVPQGFETGWYLGGNLVFGGLLGWFVIDPLTGAMWDIKDVSASLPAAAAASFHPEDYSRPHSGKSEEPSWRLKVDAKGEPVKDAEGNFVFERASANQVGR